MLLSRGWEKIYPPIEGKGTAYSGKSPRQTSSGLELLVKRIRYDETWKEGKAI